jgi:hypothetical protein
LSYPRFSPFSSRRLRTQLASCRSKLFDLKRRDSRKARRSAGDSQLVWPLSAPEEARRRASGKPRVHGSRDLDANKDALVKVNAHTVTTLVIHRDNSEVLRSSGETRPDAVEALLKKAM